MRSSCSSRRHSSLVAPRTNYVCGRSASLLIYDDWNPAVNAVFRQQGINLVYVEQKGKSRSFVQTLFKGVSKPLQRFSREGLLRYVVSLPLNLVPMVGTSLLTDTIYRSNSSLVDIGGNRSLPSVQRYVLHVRPELS